VKATVLVVDDTPLDVPVALLEGPVAEAVVESAFRELADRVPGLAAASCAFTM
jgi:hypothetical protein